MFPAFYSVRITPELLIPVYGMVMYFAYGFRLTYLAPRGVELFALSSIIFWLGVIAGAFFTSRKPKLFKITFIFPAIAYLIFPQFPFIGSFFLGIASGIFWTVMPAHFMLGTGHGKRSGLITMVSIFTSFTVALIWGSLLSSHSHARISPYYALLSLLFLPLTFSSVFSFSHGVYFHRVFLIQFLAAYASIFGSVQGLLLFRMGLRTPSELGSFIAASSLITGILSYYLGHLTDKFGGRKEAIKALGVLLPPFYLYTINTKSVYGMLVSTSFISAIGSVAGSLALALQADYKLKGIESMAFRQYCYAVASILAYIFSFNIFSLSFVGLVFSLLLLAL